MSTVLAEPTSARACVFGLAAELFAVDVRCAREVVVFDDYTIVPCGPGHLIGVANLRGYVVPILDIGPLLGLPPRPVAREGVRTLVIEDRSVQVAQVAVAIDRVFGLEYLDDRVQATEAVRRAHGEFGQELFRRGDQLVTLLNVAKLLAAVSSATRPPRGRDV